MLSFDGHKSLVFATLHGEDMAQSHRNGEKRELRTQGPDEGLNSAGVVHSCL